MDEEKSPDLIALNDELLEKPKEEKEAKRNTKEALIERILNLAEENNLELTFSNTKLKRMSKKELGILLNQMTAEVLQQQMADSVGAKGTSDKAIGIATLRMMHDMMAMACENGLNQCLPPYGYQVDGFCETLKEPTVSQCVDECLEEIARESDILQYIESPYARLGIPWCGALASTVRPVNIANNQRNVRAAHMGSATARRPQTVQRGVSRRPQARKIDRAATPTTLHE